jgi:hypothetical protein
MFRYPGIAAFFSTSPESYGLDMGQKALLRSIDSDCLAHKMLRRAALKRRHVSFSTAGHRCDGAKARIVAGDRPLTPIAL